MKKILFTLISFLAVTAVSCSDDDEPKIPDNALSLNMMIGDSESTIGGSDVYINSSNNFTSKNCGIADLGKNGGLNQNPSISQIAQKMAVTPGNFYQIVLAGDVKTVAGARAIPINANYYNAFVDSWIYDKDNDIVGAKISYAECYPQVEQLPEWNKEINVKLQSKNGSTPETAVYSFPKGCKIDDNVEAYDFEHSYMKRTLNIEVADNSISFSNNTWTPGGKVEVILLVRYDNTYTRIIMDVESSI